VTRYATPDDPKQEIPEDYPSDVVEIMLAIRKEQVASEGRVLSVKEAYAQAVKDGQKAVAGLNRGARIAGSGGAIAADTAEHLPEEEADEDKDDDGKKHFFSPVFWNGACSRGL